MTSDFRDPPYPADTLARGWRKPRDEVMRLHGYRSCNSAKGARTPEEWGRLQ